ncbi:MAG: tol-pal system protein YbgF [Desulfovibrio sp.]|nr:tol-pal system protein YbgF [Desulfovibrio sp.]
MKRVVIVLLSCLSVLAGCAGTGRQTDSEESLQKLQRETDQRLRTLEQSVSALDSRVAQLNNRVYEVRTSKGRKTGMTAVPVLPVQTEAATVPSVKGGSAVTLTSHGPTSSQTKTDSALAPHARRIDPTVPPREMPVKSQKVPHPGRQTAHVATIPSATPKPDVSTSEGPSASVSVPTSLGLPPENAPTSVSKPAVAPKPDIPQPTPVRGNAVPVPTLTGADVNLPPEKTGLGLPPMEAAPQSARNSSTAKQPMPDSGNNSVKSTPVRSSQQPPAPHKSSKAEDVAYKEAVRPALAGRAGESISRFQSFLQSYPEGRYAANAEYWIGEGYYAQGNYKDALAQFEKVNARYPRHHKNADALLKTGMTLSKMGDKAGAAEAFRKLVSQFPQSEAAKRARSQGLVR